MMYFFLRNRLLSLSFFVLTFVFIDQFSKIWISNNLCHKLNYIEPFLCKKLIIVPKLISFVYRENPAAAFSILSTIPQQIRQPILIITTILGLLFLLITFLKLKNSNIFVLFSFSLLIGGAIGNLIDRIRFGYVIDFIDISADLVGFPDYHWPVFNIADSFIVVSVFYIFLFFSKHEI